MKARDLLILGAVVLVGGFALADSLRGDGSAPTPAERPTTTTRAAPPPPAEDDDLGRARLPAVPGAPGSVVLTEAGSCAVREFDLPTGVEFPNVVKRSTCQLWAAPVTTRVAVGIGEAVGDAVPFRLFDLARPGRNLGMSEALFGALVWSEDGQRAAWCDARRTGIDLEVERGRRLLPDCPTTFTPGGEVAHAVGNRLVTEERTIVRTSGAIVAAHFGQDGSLAVVVDGRRIERFENGMRTTTLELEPELEGRTPVMSPDNCAALLRTGDEEMSLVPLPCSSLRRQAYRGTTATWSPDGRWIAVGGPSQLVFVPVEGVSGEAVRWPIGVVAVAWRES